VYIEGKVLNVEISKKIAYLHGLPLVLVLGMCGMWLVHVVLMFGYNDFKKI
jgi:hypothetical protein